MLEPRGYRGLIGSRPYFGQNPPQHVQNLVVRSYCEARAWVFLLSLTEYAMPGCHMMLNEALRSLQSVEGIVLYSVFMLPVDRGARERVLRRVLEAGKSLHGAVEGLAIRTPAEAAELMELWELRLAQRATPTLEAELKRVLLPTLPLPCQGA